MRIFVLFDAREIHPYPIMGLYTTLEKAFIAADGACEVPRPRLGKERFLEAAYDLAVYEEETDLLYNDDPKNPPFETVFHGIPDRKTLNERDDAFKERILETMPPGHTYTAEDLGNAHGQAVDTIGAKYGLRRRRIE